MLRNNGDAPDAHQYFEFGLHVVMTRRHERDIYPVWQASGYELDEI